MSELPNGTRPARVLRFERPDGTRWREVTIDGLTLSDDEQFQPRVRYRLADTSAVDARLAVIANECAGWRVVASTRALPNSKWSGLQPAAVNAELEAALDLASDASFGAAARVYTDWLVGVGDPRGELASRLQANQRADEFLDLNGEALLGDLDVALTDEIQGLEWHGGLLRAATLRTRFSVGAVLPLDQLTERFLALPIARFLTRLRFGLSHPSRFDNDWTATFRAVANSRCAPWLRELRFDAEERLVGELPWAEVGDLSGHWPRFERLEWLAIHGTGSTLGVLDLPALQHFVRQSEALSAEEFDSICTATWPRLERLKVWTGSRAEGATADERQLEGLVKKRMPRLKQLSLVKCEFASRALPIIVGSGFLSQLQRLSFEHGSLDDDDAETLLRFAPKLRRLDLILDHNRFSEAAVVALQSALPFAHLHYQRQYSEME